MKIIAFSDVHGDIKKVNKVIEEYKKKEANLVILAGDITSFLKEKYIARILIPFFKKKIPLLVIPGNHDENETLNLLINKFSKVYEFDKVKNIEKDFIKIKDFIFLGFSANNIYPTVDIYTEEESEEILDNLIKRLKRKYKRMNSKKLITISHIHPSGPIEEEYGYEGSNAWRNFILKYQPLLHLHGHIHETEGKKYNIGKTIVYNLGPHPHFFDLKLLLNQRNEKGKKKNDHVQKDK